MAEGEQLLRLGDYLRWVKEAKALLQQCNHGKEDGQEEGYVKSVFVVHVGWYSLCNFQYRQHDETTCSDHFDG